jgi:hypothetical protein
MPDLDDAIRVEQPVEAFWRERLEDARSKYQEAAADFHVLMLQMHVRDFPSPDGSMAFSRALRAESVARKNYMRVLRIYTDLLLGHSRSRGAA